MTTSTSTDGSPRTPRSEAAEPLSPPGAGEPSRASDAPSPELLEFLGEFSDGAGGGIDPFELDDGPRDAGAAGANEARGSDD